MKKILITSFERFGKFEKNSTEEVMKNFPKFFQGYKVVHICLPVVYDQCAEILFDAINQHKPISIVLLGQTRKRDGISLEKIAYNLDNALLSDNSWNIRNNRIIQKNWQKKYFSTLPIENIWRKIWPENSIISLSGGRFLCNHLFYQTMYFLEKNNINIPAGFIHLPCLNIEQQYFSEKIFTRTLDELEKYIITILEEIIIFLEKK